MSRSAYTLVEMLVAITGTSVALSLTGALIQRSMRTQAETRHFMDVERAAVRLADQFRRDVHAAERVERGNVGETAEGLLLHVVGADGETVDYRRSGGKIVRVRQGAGGPTAREEYRLCGTMHAKIRTQDEPPSATLTIESPLPTPRDEPAKLRPGIREAYVNLEATAVIGRNARLALR